MRAPAFPYTDAVSIKQEHKAPRSGQFRLPLFIVIDVACQGSLEFIFPAHQKERWSYTCPDELIMLPPSAKKPCNDLLYHGLWAAAHTAYQKRYNVEEVVVKWKPNPLDKISTFKKSGLKKFQEYWKEIRSPKKWTLQSLLNESVQSHRNLFLSYLYNVLKRTPPTEVEVLAPSLLTTPQTGMDATARAAFYFFPGRPNMLYLLNIIKMLPEPIKIPSDDEIDTEVVQAQNEAVGGQEVDSGLVEQNRKDAEIKEAIRANAQNLIGLYENLTAEILVAMKAEKADLAYHYLCFVLLTQLAFLDTKMIECFGSIPGLPLLASGIDSFKKDLSTLNIIGDAEDLRIGSYTEQYTKRILALSANYGNYPVQDVEAEMHRMIPEHISLLKEVRALFGL